MSGLDMDMVRTAREAAAGDTAREVAASVLPTVGSLAARDRAVEEARADRVEGVNPKQAQGRKKVRPHLIPTAGLIAVAEVMKLGAEKYDPMNWRDNPIDLTDYEDAAMRHWLAIADGEDLDPESNQSHWAHLAATALIVLDAAAVGTLVDDRPTRGVSAQLIRDLKAKSE